MNADVSAEVLLYYVYVMCVRIELNVPFFGIRDANFALSAAPACLPIRDTVRLIENLLVFNFIISSRKYKILHM